MPSHLLGDDFRHKLLQSLIDFERQCFTTTPIGFARHQINSFDFLTAKHGQNSAKAHADWLLNVMKTILNTKN